MAYIGKQPTKAALTASDIEDGIITAAKIEDGAVVAAEIASNAVTTAKINADAVTTAKINADAVTGSEIADDAINSEHYTDGSIDTAHLADGQVTTAKLATAVFTGATDIGADIADADLFLMDDGAGGTIRKTAASRIKTYAGGLTGVTTDSGNVTITDGNLTFGGAGHGVHLGVTSATAANLLDDYEEGTFTPSIVTGSGSITPSEIHGGYTKIGRMVYFIVYAVIDSVSSPSGHLKIHSLPFTIANESANEGAFCMSYYNWETGAYFLNGEAVKNSTTLYIFNNNNGSRSNCADKVKGGSQFHMNGFYYV